ncbi:8-amino-7-oxononanoate synthase [Sphingomonas paeninsulae]|uniref:8-amino-7-oxononanoate synthase n=1 Tax=Sphingomonas paeninsulae TaxID=2319844 RepID=A0A494TGL1_SPHPE|nr:8-amino-7-oxononanoate synthase [Sphingomonas paeninsulae]AYJ86574.1 8-amino-7-oxononanoate synthase [Sphingomonas paeninsulae]
MQTIDAQMFDAQTRDLAQLAVLSRRRQLIPRAGRDFSSNDYLGLASSPRLAAAVAAALASGVPLGSGGSRLLRGNHLEHEALEHEAAVFFGSESALFFSSGYAANAALLCTLPQRGDLIVYDELVHASAHEGMRLGRAEYRAAGHNDVDGFADVITSWRREGGTGRVWIAVESLYSMDGDRAPLGELMQLARRHDGYFLIDDAHGTGVFGPEGRGLAAPFDGLDNVIVLRTCGKALGCEGALLCGPQIMRDFLVNRSRAFIFSTAPSPLMAAAVRAALRLLVEEPERQNRLHALIDIAGTALAPFGALVTGSQIMPVILGDDARTMRVATSLQAAGFDVRGIRPPTVPAGTSRLRISLTLNIGADDILALAAKLEDALK